MVEEPGRTRGSWVPYIAGAAVPVIAGLIVVALLVSGRSSDAAVKPAGAGLPAPRVLDLDKAAEAAGCELADNPDEPYQHYDMTFTPGDYDHNPPMGGNHAPTWYQDGMYAPGETPNLGMTVHPLEHGRIEIQYAPGTPKATVARLTRFYQQMDGGYHMLLFQNGTHMPYAIAATAWGHAVGCRKMNERVWDVLRDFRTAYIDKGPEVVP
jgi:hypothetical protein